MSSKVIGRVWDLDLPHNKLLILLALADHADHEGNNVYPSLGLVAWKTGYSEQQVRRIIRELESDAILIAVDRSAGHATKYRIDLSAGKQKAPRNPLQNVTPSKMSPLTFRPQTPDIAMSPESITKRKDTAKRGITFPENFSKWTRKHTEAYFAANTDAVDCLLQVWFVLQKDMRPRWSELTLSEQKEWSEIHRDLTVAGWACDQYAGLAAFTKNRWKDAPPKYMLKVASEYRVSLATPRLESNGNGEGRRGVREEDSINYYLPPTEETEYTLSEAE